MEIVIYFYMYWNIWATIKILFVSRHVESNIILFILMHIRSISMSLGIKKVK